MKIKVGMLCFWLFVAGSLGFLFLHAQNNAEGMLAPLNPEFLKMIDAQRAGTFHQNPMFGYLPGPVDHSLNTAIPIPPDRPIEGYAATYDLRTSGKVSPIRDQGSCGACWAFSGIGGIESSLMPTVSRNFSEQHLNKYHGFDWAECAGGNSNISQAYFARWDGPYNETDYPYLHGGYGIGTSAISGVQKHVQRAVWLPNDKDTIKAFVSSSLYGAVGFAFYVDENDSAGLEYNTTDAYYNATNYAYYYYQTPTGSYGGHEILIVGWDDNFAKTKFSHTPTNNGAWLCKNSWGTSYENAGYFWMSYEDHTIHDICVFSFVKPVSDYKNIYQYDPYGYVYGWGNGTTTYWAANVFTAGSSDPLKAISYVTTDGGSLNYWIYKNPTTGAPKSGTLLASGSDGWVYSTYGFTPVGSIPLTAGDKFSVVIQFINNSYTYPLALEGVASGYASAPTNASGQSYYSVEGTTWYDWTSYSSNSYKMNNCIKAFTGTNLFTRNVDFNADSKEDLLWRHYGTGQNSVWYLGGYTASPAALVADPAKIGALRDITGSLTRSLAVVEMNQSYASSKVYGDVSEVGGMPSPPAKAFVFAPPANPGTGDIRQGTNLSLANAGQLFTWPAIGPKTETINITSYGSLPTVTDVNWKIAATGDFNADGKIDLVWRNTSTGVNSLWFMNGITPTGYASLPTVADQNWQIGGTGDFNGDGQTDIVWRNSSTGANSIWLMNGSTPAAYPNLQTVADANWQIGGTGDFNGDGQCDILWRNSATGVNTIWLMDGTANLGYANLAAITDLNWQIVGTADFNADGKPDIIWRNSSTGQNAVWYMNGVTNLAYDYLQTVTDASWRISNR